MRAVPSTRCRAISSTVSGESRGSSAEIVAAYAAAKPRAKPTPPIDADPWVRAVGRFGENRSGHPREPAHGRKGRPRSNRRRRQARPSDEAATGLAWFVSCWHAQVKVDFTRSANRPLSLLLDGAASDTADQLLDARPNSQRVVAKWRAHRQRAREFGSVAATPRES